MMELMLLLMPSSLPLPPPLPSSSSSSVIEVVVAQWFWELNTFNAKSHVWGYKRRHQTPDSQQSSHCRYCIHNERIFCLQFQIFPRILILFYYNRVRSLNINSQWTFVLYFILNYFIISIRFLKFFYRQN